MTLEQEIEAIYKLDEEIKSCAPGIPDDWVDATLTVPARKIKKAVSIIRRLEAKNEKYKKALEEIIKSDNVHEIWYHQIAKEALQEI